MIDHEDQEFNQDYWIKFTKFQSDAKDEAQKFQLILNNDFQEFNTLYEKSRKNLSQTIDKLKNNDSVNESLVNYLKDAKKALGKTEEFIVLMEGFQNASNPES